jgi:hypothetical protein
MKSSRFHQKAPPAGPTTGTSTTSSPNGTDVVTGTSGGVSLTGSTAEGVSSCVSGRVQ